VSHKKRKGKGRQHASVVETDNAPRKRTKEIDFEDLADSIQK